MNRLHIRGLVKAMRHVRDRLERGVSAQEEPALRDYVRRVVSTVERLCREHRTTPDELPRPSREAYRYLVGLRDAPSTVRHERASASPSSPQCVASVPSVVRTANWLLDVVESRLVSVPPHVAATELAPLLNEAVGRIERACAAQGGTPAHLPLPSRRAYAMLAFLSSNGVAATYAEAVAAMKEIGEGMLCAGGKHTGALRIRFDDQTGLYRYRRRGNSAVLRLNPGFLAADDEMLRIVAEEALGGKRKERRGIIHQFVHSEAFIGIGQELDDLVAGEPQTEGAFYDLTQVCDRVRRTHFDHPVDAPSSLAWTDRLTYHTFGHYNSLRDRITISRSLDHRSVPRYVVEFVMYHELLHRVHGIGWKVSRRAMHTSAFRADERTFPRHDAAQRFLSEWAAKLRRRLA